MGISLVCGDDEDWRIVDLPEYVRDLVRIAIVSPDHPHAATRRHLCQHTEGSILPLLKADHPIIRCLDLLGRQGVIGDLLEVPLNPFETPHFLSISGGQSSGYRPLRLSPSWPNGGDQRLATLDFPSGPILSRVRCIALCTPVMGVIVWGASPLCEIGSLKEIRIPSDHSDWQSTR